MFKVGVNGFGTIGRRVAAAILKQKDMKLIGISDINPSWEVRYASSMVPVFISLREYGKDKEKRLKEVKEIFISEGINPKGTLFELISESELIIDATPAGVGEKNKEDVYSKEKNLHLIFQGGEKASISRVTFNAYVNYKNCVEEQIVRVPSCNTTAMLRYLNCIQNISEIKKATINLIRRGADPHEFKSGPINDYIPTEIPSHHAEDVIAADPRLKDKLLTYGVTVPVTIMHMHNVIINGKFTSREKILEEFQDCGRIAVVGGKTVPTAAQVMEANERKDLYSIVILEKTLHLSGDTLLFSAYVHQEADVIPENMDAIRASLGFEDAQSSIDLTDKNLGILETKKKLESYFPVY